MSNSNEMVGSGAYSLNTSDLLSLGKNALLVGAASMLTYLGENISQLDLGSATALIVPIVAIALNAGVKWVKDNTKKT